MRMNIRRMAQGERKHHKRSKRLNKVKKLIVELFHWLIFLLSLGRNETKPRFIPRVPAEWISEAVCERYELEHFNSPIIKQKN